MLLGFQGAYGFSTERRENGDGEDASEVSGEWRRSLVSNDFVLCGESEEGLKVMVGHFDEVCRRWNLKGKSKVMVLDGEEGLVSEVLPDGM